ncbi:hypothetical protein C8R43DRAFT_902104 [Mycena crocata]|nr:hypothetical protein C8R43DRAFT_902104 [Mycena crocata]
MQTDPMSHWRPVKGDFLDEILRHEGLGDDLDKPECAHCLTAFDVNDPESPRLFKCEDCGEFLQCLDCCLSHHSRTPLHVIKEWTGQFWESRSLAAMGLVYQLGHGGFPCRYPDMHVYNLTVIDAPYIHRIKVQYCKCDKSDDADNLEQLMRNRWYPATVTDPGTCATFRSLESYRLYNVVGNMNVRDYITALEEMTDASAKSGMTWLPVSIERYKQFQRMARQWSFLMRMQESGRAHDPAGVDATGQGECGVNCWACPHDGRNLPPGWREVDPQYLYMLLLAMDANFRLKNRKRTNEIDDPSLGPGWGYWVEPTAYKQHLKGYVNEKDISTCIAFAALLQKDTRMTTGLRVSGVGGVVCARHECVRPNGLGDLQKGERYANMDYILMSALAGFTLMCLTISYDIACQWKAKLPERNSKLPTAIQLPLDKIEVQCALPVWHAASHNEDCQNANSLSFKEGVGKSDGEGVERVWSRLNPGAYSTKDAGTGQRADTYEGKIHYLNTAKNLGQGYALQRKMVVALAERDRQVAAFDDISATVKSSLKTEWKKMIADWTKDPSKPNPFTLTRKDCPTEAEVRLQVRQDEDALTAEGRAPLHGRSATAFLTAGIQIEDAQRRIMAELRGRVLVAADRQNRIEEWRHALLVKISKFRALQKVYMPRVDATISETEAERDQDETPPQPERVKLWMPSDVPANEAHQVCVPGLPDMEAKLRVGQCTNSLVSLRARLHAKRHFIGFRNENITGQAHATKASTLIGELGERAMAYGRRYRKGRLALVRLKGADAYPALRKLEDSDIRLDGDNGESDAAARKKLGMIAAGRGERAPRNAPGTSKRTMSWIWTAPGVFDDDEQRLHESVRVEWSRARARKIRWQEEVKLLREEMRRVLRYLIWQSEWWLEREATRKASANVSRELEAGLRAYALKQASWHARLGGFFRAKWNVSALAAAQRLVAVEPEIVENLDDLFTEDS